MATTRNGKNQDVLSVVAENGENVLKLAGEVFVLPGTSLLADGKSTAGLLHAGAGLAAKAAIGGPAMLLVAANSYCRSVYGKDLVSLPLPSLPSLSDINEALGTSFPKDNAQNGEVQNANAPNANSQSGDPKAGDLVHKVSLEIASGRSLEQIQARIAEDVEDIFVEASEQGRAL